MTEKIVQKNACLVFTHMFIWEIKTAFVAPAKPAVTILCRSGRINDEDLAKILKLRSKPYANTEENNQQEGMMIHDI